MSEAPKSPEEAKKEVKGVSRRNFLIGTVGGIVVGAAAGSVAGSLAFPTIPNSTYRPWLPSKWDYTADVVIVGDGFAGLTAAIAAQAAGAEVLVLEKMDQAHEGGSSKVTGGGIWVPASESVGVTAIAESETGQLTDQSIISAMATGMLANVNAVTQLGGTLTVLEKTSTGAYYVLSQNGTSALGKGLLYTFFRNYASSKKIDIMYNTPATSLIQNGDTKEILGVAALSGATTASTISGSTITVATTGGTPINVRANKAVILACGGPDYNFAMQSQFFDGYPVRSWGGLGNTGDGVRMAQQVGADLWHMTHPASVSAGCAFVIPGYPYTAGSDIGTSIGNNYIWVDREGNRFVNESLGSDAYEYMMLYDQTNQVFARIPTWVIFDSTAASKGPFVSPALDFGWFLIYSGYTWSSDNSAEIKAGWITQANTISDLAGAIASDPDNQNSSGTPMLTAATLTATVTRWNSLVSAGADTDFGRVTLAAIQTPPFYAVKTWPSMECSKGGPRRNANCQVVDPSGNPIPRLYSAGIGGSFWGAAGIGGGNIAEALWTGRTTGTNAAALTDWT